MAGLAVPRSVKSYRCRYCGAPLRVGPDAAVVVCPYCGKPNWIRGSGSVLVVEKTVSIDEAREGFVEFARRDPDLRKVRGLDVARVEIVFIPFYEGAGRLSAEYDYRGYIVQTRTVKRGDRYETVTRQVPFHVTGVFSTGFKALVSGKRALGEEAVDELAEHYLSSRPRLVGVEEFEWRSGEYTALAADYDPGEARVRLVDDACDWARGLVDEEAKRRARARHGGGTVVVTDRKISCRVEEASVRGPVLLPLVKVFYLAEGKVYRAFFSGWDMAPLVREEPLTGTQRALLAVLGGVIAGGGGALGVAAAISHEEPVLGLLGLGLSGFLGYVVSRLALREARIEEGGPSRWISSIGEELERTGVRF